MGFNTQIVFVSLALCVLLCSDVASARRRGGSRSNKDSKEGKFLSFFQLVRFPNDGCGGSDAKNGTCYTSDECLNKGGTSSGSCAEGYGVCCTFSMNCGDMSSENTTYFENSGSEVGECTYKVCKLNSKISQLRLDFNAFAINGPSTDTLSSGLLNAKALSTGSKCLIDTFEVTSPGSPAPPVVCGTLTNEHMYVDASTSCNALTFLLGTSGTAMRQWSVKVSQYENTFNNLAPSGCTQYYYGATSGSVKTFNFDSGVHLANQRQKFCFRRETNQCRICYSIDAVTDFELSGAAGIAVKGLVSKCCGYGANGAMSSGYDCLVIPQASKTTSASEMITYSEFCGSGVSFSGLVSATSKTVCSKKLPFEITFLSDNFEYVGKDEDTDPNAGFKLSYIQSGGC